jgi:hypothetical protein
MKYGIKCTSGTCDGRMTEKVGTGHDSLYACDTCGAVPDERDCVECERLRAERELILASIRHAVSCITRVLDVAEEKE